MERVLSRLLEHDLAVNLGTSEFHVHNINFLGYILGGDSTLRMEPGKIAAIQQWEVPTRKKKVQAFLSFANYYRRFIKDYARRVKPLTELTKGGNGAKIPFTWYQQQQEAFDDLKKAFQEAPILAQFDPTLPVIVETDASNQAISGILSQAHPDPDSVKREKVIWKLVDCHARTLSAQQRNWPIHDKELWAIVSSLIKWRSWLSGLQFEVHTDHQGLQYFQTKQRLNARQARWQQDIAEFHFTIKYKPGSTMQKVDALTRKVGTAKEGIECQFFSNGTVSSEILALEPILEEHELEGHDKVELQDPEVDEIDVSSRNRNNEGLLIPPDETAKLEVLRTCHDSGIAGHWGKYWTQEMVARNFWWPGVNEAVAAYIAGCHRCQLAKADRHSKMKGLVPMPTGLQPWEEIAMDFVGELPESEGFNAILVITDRFTKIQRYIPAKTSWTAEDVANVYITDIWRHYGLPKGITTDRGPQFASAFIRSLNKALNIHLRTSTAHRPQTDGLAERAVQTLKQYLRVYCHDRQKRWVRWLPLAEFAYNSAPHSVTKLSPMFALYGFEPRRIQVSTEEVASPAAEDWLYRMTTVHNQVHATLKAVNERRVASSPQDRARKYSVGDQVLVDRRNLTFPAGTKKSLSDRWIGPYRVITDRWNGYAYGLDIPARTRIHPVIHVSLLKPYRDSVQGAPVRQRDPVLGVRDAALVDEGEDILFHVKEFVDSRWFGVGAGRVVKYRVRWQGYGPVDDTWQTIDESGWPASPEILQGYRSYHDLHPRKVADPRVTEALELSRR